MSNYTAESAPSTFSHRLKELGDRVGSLKELSALTGIPYANVLRYIQGTEPKREALASIISKLNVNGTWLLTGLGSPDDNQRDQSSSTRSTVELAKFSPRMYQEMIEEAVDFDTRGWRMKMLYSDLYQTDRMHIDRPFVLKLFGSEEPEIVVYEYDDVRTKNAPLFVYVNMYDSSFKEGQKALIMIKGNLYIVKATGTDIHEELSFHDISTESPLKPITLSELNRAEALIGKIVTAIYRE